MDRCSYIFLHYDFYCARHENFGSDYSNKIIKKKIANYYSNNKLKLTVVSDELSIEGFSHGVYTICIEAGNEVVAKQIIIQ